MREQTESKEILNSAQEHKAHVKNLFLLGQVETAESNKNHGSPTLGGGSGEALLGKRVNRGYNPKYETTFLCKPTDFNLGLNTGSAVTSKTQKPLYEQPASSDAADAVHPRLNKSGVPIRKVGRPPKDKSLEPQERMMDVPKKSLKAQRYQEFRNIIS